MAFLLRKGAGLFSPVTKIIGSAAPPVTKGISSVFSGVTSAIGGLFGMGRKAASAVERWHPSLVEG